MRRCKAWWRRASVHAACQSSRLTHPPETLRKRFNFRRPQPVHSSSAGSLVDNDAGGSRKYVSRALEQYKCSNMDGRSGKNTTAADFCDRITLLDRMVNCERMPADYQQKSDPRFWSSPIFPKIWSKRFRNFPAYLEPIFRNLKEFRENQ